MINHDHAMRKGARGPGYRRARYQCSRHKGRDSAKRKQEDALAVFLAAREWLRECQEAAALTYGSLLAAREALFAFNDKRAAAQERKT